MNKSIPIHRIVDFAAGNLSQEESLDLLDQIEKDEQASRDLELITSMMDLVEEEGDTLAAERATRTGRALSWLRSCVASLCPKVRIRPVLSGAAAFAVVFVALMIMLPSSSPYGDLASLQDFDFGATVRGVDLGDFETSFDLYGEGKYEESIKLFERYIRAFPRSEMLEYAHYSAGAAYLRWSEWRFALLFIGFDRDRVLEGMQHLHEVVRISSNKRLLEDARWLLAKGHLMLSNVDASMDELHSVTNMGGSRSEEAARMIRDLQTIHQQR